MLDKGLDTGRLGMGLQKHSPTLCLQCAYRHLCAHFVTTMCSISVTAAHILSAPQSAPTHLWVKWAGEQRLCDSCPACIGCCGVAVELVQQLERLGGAEEAKPKLW